MMLTLAAVIAGARPLLAVGFRHASEPAPGLASAGGECCCASSAGPCSSRGQAEPGKYTFHPLAANGGGRCCKTAETGTSCNGLSEDRVERYETAVATMCAPVECPEHSRLVEGACRCEFPFEGVLQVGPETNAPEGVCAPRRCPSGAELAPEMLQRGSAVSSASGSLCVCSGTSGRPGELVPAADGDYDASFCRRRCPSDAEDEPVPGEAERGQVQASGQELNGCGRHIPASDAAQVVPASAPRMGLPGPHSGALRLGSPVEQEFYVFVGVWELALPPKLKRLRGIAWHSETIMCEAAQFGEKERVFLDRSLAEKPAPIEMSVVALPEIAGRGSFGWKSSDARCAQTFYGRGWDDRAGSGISLPSERRLSLDAAMMPSAAPGAHKYLYGKVSGRDPAAARSEMTTCVRRGKNWAAEDYALLTYNCNTFTEHLLGCWLRLEHQIPGFFSGIVSNLGRYNCTCD